MDDSTTTEHPKMAYWRGYGAGMRWAAREGATAWLWHSAAAFCVGVATGLTLTGWVL